MPSSRCCCWCRRGRALSAGTSSIRGSTFPIHFLLTGASAAMLYFGLARLDLLPKLDQPSLRRSVGAIVLIVTLLGGTASLLWEIYEWLAENFLPSRILVGYDDTILDMTNGILGSLVAGLCVAWWQRTGHGLRERA